MIGAGVWLSGWAARGNRVKLLEFYVESRTNVRRELTAIIKPIEFNAQIRSDSQLRTYYFFN